MKRILSVIESFRLKVCFGVWLIIGAWVASSAGCGGCEDKPYNRFKLEIFTQQLSETPDSIPFELRELLKPLSTEYYSEDGRCFCATSGLHAVTNQPFVRVTRIDSGFTNNSFDLPLALGAPASLSYAEFAQGFGFAIDMAEYPEWFNVENSKIECGAMRMALDDDAYVFFYSSNPQHPDSILIGEQSFSVFGDYNILKDSISVAVQHHNGEFGNKNAMNTIPSVQLFYDIQTSPCDPEIHPSKIKVSDGQPCIGFPVTFEVISSDTSRLAGATWFFGDRESADYSKKETHSYSEGGVFPVQLRDAKRNILAETEITVIACPLSSLCQGKPGIYCVKDSLKLCDTITFSAVLPYEEGCIYAKSWKLDGKQVADSLQWNYKCINPGRHLITFVLNDHDSTQKVIWVESPGKPKMMKLRKEKKSVSWDPIGKEAMYHVTFSLGDSIIAIHEQLTTRVEIPYQLEVGPSYKINVVALQCGHKIGIGPGRINLVTRGGVVVIDGNCEN